MSGNTETSTVPTGQFVARNRVACIAAVALCAVAIGCRSARVDYVPLASLSLAAARSIVLQVLEEQPHGLAPDQAEVSYDKITTHRARRKTITYFNAIDSLDLHLDRRGNYYFVRIFDNAGDLRLRVWMRELEKGKRFMDGVRVLMANASLEENGEFRAEQERLKELREITESIERIKRERDEQRRTLELKVEEPDA